MLEYVSFLYISPSNEATVYHDKEPNHLDLIHTSECFQVYVQSIKDILYPEEVIQSFIWNVKTERLGLIMNSKKHPNEE